MIGIHASIIKNMFLAFIFVVLWFLWCKITAFLQHNKGEIPILCGGNPYVFDFFV